MSKMGQSSNSKPIFINIEDEEDNESKEKDQPAESMEDHKPNAEQIIDSHKSMRNENKNAE